MEKKIADYFKNRPTENYVHVAIGVLFSSIDDANKFVAATSCTVETFTRKDVEQAALDAEALAKELAAASPAAAEIGSVKTEGVDAPDADAPAAENEKEPAGENDKAAEAPVVNANKSPEELATEKTPAAALPEALNFGKKVADKPAPKKAETKKKTGKK